MEITPNEKLMRTATQAAAAATEVMKAAGAVEAADQTDMRTAVILAGALREVFGENVDSCRFIDVTKIPLICRSITDMHTNIAEIKLMLKESQEKFVSADRYKPVEKIVYGLVAIFGVAIVGSIMKLILIK